MANANDLQKTLAEDANLTKKQRESMLRSSLAFILSDLRGDQSQTEPKKEELKELPLVTDVKCHMVSETIDTAETNLQEALSDPVEIVEEIQPTPTTSQASFDSFELLLTCDEPFRQGNFNNFLKGCKWSPDGTCILTASEDRHARVFTLPADLYNGKYSLSVSENLAVLSSARHGDLIYDYHWYPLMNSQSYDTCV